ncbi:MAG: hypothetical protein ACRC6T_03580 [Sarcina sp.]
MKNLIEIKNLIINANLITFSLSENLSLTKNDFSIYIDNSKILINEFSLEKSEQNYSLIISPSLALTGTLYFFITTHTHFSGIIYIYYDIGLLEFSQPLSLLNLAIPSDIESSNYIFSFLTFDNRTLTSPSIPLIICNGLSTLSNLEFQSSTSDNKTFEVTLLDSLEIPVPDGEYIIEIITGE